MIRGYAAVGLIQPKTKENVGSVLRAAHCYGAAMVAIEGDRTDIRSPLDTNSAWKHMPVMRGDLRSLIPYAAVPIAVDLIEGATPLPDFVHPERAFYIFGPEDGTLGKSVTSWCAHTIMVPTNYCMNLAASVNVILYDRMAKSGRK